jgi:hypothetical protein
MYNFKLETDHIKAKLEASASADIDRKVVVLAPTLDGEYFTKDVEGNYWRVSLFIAKI